LIGESARSRVDFARFRAEVPIIARSGLLIDRTAPRSRARPGAHDAARRGRAPDRGALLRERLGGGFAHVALTLGAPADGSIPRPTPEYAEAVLDAARFPAYVLDLRGEVPDEVRTWLDGHAAVRVVGPRYGPSVRIEGRSLAGWSDAVAHVRDTTPAHPLRGG